jgi:hypothetical protein
MERSTITERIGEMKHKTLWKWFAMALGEKASKCDNESDIVARIRAVIFLTYLITNVFIIYGVTRTHIFPATLKPIECIIINK